MGYSLNTVEIIKYKLVGNTKTQATELKCLASHFIMPSRHDRCKRQLSFNASQHSAAPIRLEQLEPLQKQGFFLCTVAGVDVLAVELVHQINLRA